MISTVYKLCFCVFLFVFCFACPSCRKDKPEPAETATGSITGIIKPAGAVTEVVAYDTTSGNSFRATPDSSGKFIITPLQPGYYKLYFTMGYLAYIPPSVPPAITVRKNETTDLGVLTFTLPTDSTRGATIAGHVYPAKGFGEITATSSGNAHQYKTTPDAAGAFGFLNVVPDTYTLHFNVTDTALQPVADSVITVTKDQYWTLDIYATPKPNYSTGKIDTITGNYLFETDLLSRAPYDSLIVIQGNLSVFTGSNTEALTSALQKIVSISGLLNYTDPTVTSIAMDKLTYLGSLEFFGAPLLTQVSFKNLKTIAGGINMYQTSQLTAIDWPLLTTLSGSLSLYYTNFSSLDFLKNISFHPFSVELIGNSQLSDISALNFASDSVYNLTVRLNSLLTTLNGLQGIRLVKNKITISYNPLLQTLEGMNNIVNANVLELSNNAVLSTVCPAKTVINAVKDKPTFTVRSTDINGQWITITVYPFVAQNNGTYATENDMKAAIALCP